MIRPARPEDAAAICAILNPVIRDTTISFNPIEKSEADMADEIAERPCFFVAATQGRVVGFANAVQFRRGLGYRRSFEHSIGLAPEARRQGIGRALLQAVEDSLRAKGAGSLWAGVSGENLDGIDFHRALGFTDIARLPRVGWKFDRWLDLVLMMKRLDEGDGQRREG